MEFPHLRAASPVKIIIVPKAEEKPDLNSNILNNFAAFQDKVTDKPPIGAPTVAHAKPYSPYITSVIKSLHEQAVEKKEAHIPTQIEEMVYVKEHVDTDIELTVFKHREVNSLIRNRILALENSVVSKTVEKNTMIEVDKTIKEVVQEQQDEPILEQLKSRQEKEVMLPTSKIREIASAMHRKKPVFEIPIPKKPEIQPESESESESEDESEEESEDESESSAESENVVEPLVVTKAILKEPEPPKLLRPILTKQYSFDMEKKFHEEKDDDGWKKVAEIKLTATSSSDSDDRKKPVVQKDVPSKSVEPKKEISSYVQSDSDSSLSGLEHEPKKHRDGRRNYPPGASPEEKRRLDEETIQRILTYERSMDRDGGYEETLEEYMRRRNEKIGYDTDLNTSISEYESDGYTEGSDYSEFTNAVDNESFINYDRRAWEGDYDSRSEYTEYTDYTETSDYTLRYGSESEYYTDDVARDGYYDDRSDRSEYYSEEGDDVTLIDEEEYARERAHGRAPDYDQRQMGEISLGKAPGYDQRHMGEISLGKAPGYDQHHFDGAYTDEYTDIYSDYTER